MRCIGQKERGMVFWDKESSWVALACEFGKFGLFLQKIAHDAGNPYQKIRV